MRWNVGVALALLLGAGCDYVVSSKPVGESPLVLEESEWKGTWLHGDGPLTVRIAEAQEGRLEVAWIEEKDDALVLESVSAQLRTSGDWIFASFTGIDDELDKEGYLWGRLERDEDRLLLWWPRPERFRRLVEEGLLPGEVDDGDVVLGELGEQHLAIIGSEEHGVLFAWDEPMTFQRLR